MKKLVFVLLLLGLSFSACSTKKDTLMVKATITGPDLRMCACCGGWYIDIGKKTYRFYNLPDDSNLDLKTAEFPLKVNVIWKKDEEDCGADLIIIEKIKKR